MTNTSMRRTNIQSTHDKDMGNKINQDTINKSFLIWHTLTIWQVCVQKTMNNQLNLSLVIN